MKKVKIGNPQFPNTHIEKEFTDDKTPIYIVADLLLGIMDKLKLGNNKTLSNNKVKDLGSMLDGLEKNINELDPKMGVMLRAEKLRLKTETHKK